MGYKRLKLKVGKIPAKETLWQKKKVLLNLGQHKDFGKFRKTEYKKKDWHIVAEISTWNSPENELLIDIDTYHDMKIDRMFSPDDIKRVRLSETDIFMLADKLKELKKIQLKEWKIGEE